MKRNIYLLLLLGLAVQETKTNNYVSSVFWYCPASNLPNQLFFGAESPSAMEGTYGQNLTGIIPFVGYDGAEAQKALNYLIGSGGGLYSETFFEHGAMFNQALIGPYFSTWGGSDLYITQPHSPKNGANAAQLRLLGLGIQDCTGSLVPSLYGHSYGMLKELLHNNLVFWHYVPTNNGVVCYFDVHKTIGSMWAYLKGEKIGIEEYYTNKASKPWDWTFLTSREIMVDSLMVFYQSFQSSLFKEQIHISNSDFNPPLSNVSGLDATTYFKNNKNYTVYLRFNLITPSNMMRVTEHTDLYYATVYQNTYTHMYSQDGSSDCGDDYGF